MHQDMSRISKRAIAFACSIWLTSAPVWSQCQGPAQKPVAKPTVAAETPSGPGKASGASSAVPLTAEDVSSFLDGFMPQQLEQADIAGAVIAVVKDGQLLFARGYGYSDYEKR